ncbi:MAG: NAD(P)-dependent oxidoreductase [Dehalococcoidia bacterium]
MTETPRPQPGDSASYEVVVPDDFPPVFSDSLAHARLSRTPGVKVRVYTSRPSAESELDERIWSAHTVLSIRSSTRFTHNVLASAPGLRHLALWGTATDHVALDAAHRLGITVTNTPETATDAVAEHALALSLALARRIPELDQRVREGEWPRGILTQLAGKTMGIVGTGAIGMQLARLARGIGMEVLAVSLHADGEVPFSRPQWVRFVPLSELLQASDVVSLHGRLIEPNVRLFGAEQFTQMKPTALFINTARGGLVDEAALAEALRNETIAGAALDVFSREPLSKDSPLRYMPNVILSPHTAATTAEALRAGLDMAVDNVLCFLEGRIQHRVV